MKPVIYRSVTLPAVDIASTAEFILCVQKPNGEIPWSIGGKTDPWDHVESAMGLSVAGYLREAERAYEWMEATSATTEAGRRIP